MPTSSFRVPRSDEKFRKSLNPHHEVIFENGRRVTIFCHVHKKEETLSRCRYYSRKKGGLCCFYDWKKLKSKKTTSVLSIRCKNEDERLAYRNWVRNLHIFFNHKCFLSGFKTTREDPLQCHHLYSWHHYPSLRYEPNNGVLLKASVHYAFHTALGGTREIATRESFEQWARDHYGVKMFPWNNNHEPKKIHTHFQCKETLEKRIRRVAKQRNHKILHGSMPNIKSKIKVQCLNHFKVQEIAVENYEQNRHGLRCCSSAKLSQSKTEFHRKTKKPSQKKRMLKLLAERNHRFVHGSLAHDDHTFTFRCLRHNETAQISVKYYKNFAWGILCCARENQKNLHSKPTHNGTKNVWRILNSF